MNNALQHRFRTAAVALLLLGGCVTTDLTRGDFDRIVSTTSNVAKAVRPGKLTPAQEEVMGRNVAATLLGAAPLLRDDALQSHVNRVGLWIAMQTGVDNIHWRFGIIDTPNVNAFAAPAGYVLVTRGLLARLDDESALAGVLAHEIAHVVERHHAEAMRKKERAGALANLANDLNDSRNKEAFAKIVNLTKGVYTAGLDKKDEYEADRLGVVYAARAGYQPFGLARVLQIYAAAGAESGFELLVSTHPAANTRADALELAMGDRLAAYESGSVEDTPEFRRLMGGQKTQLR